MSFWRVETMLKTRDKVEWAIWHHDEPLPVRSAGLEERTTPVDTLRSIAHKFATGYANYTGKELSDKDRFALNKELAIEWGIGKDYDMTWAEYQQKLSDAIMADMALEWAL